MRSTVAALGTLLTAAALGTLLTATSGTAQQEFNDICVRTTDWDKRAPGALRMRGVDHSLWLVWSDDADRASAALLLRRLAEHPRCQTLTCRLALCHSPGGLCDLLNDTLPMDGLVTAFVAGVQPLSEMSCKVPRYLSAVGSHLAPLRTREHVVLAPAAAARPACFASVEPAFFSSDDDDAELRACLFEPGAPYPRARSAVELRALVAAVDGRVSFRFRDAELWSDEQRVLTPRDVSFEPALTVTEEVNLLMHAPWALDALREHAPSGRALRDLLAREAADAGSSGAERGRAAVVAAAAAPASDAPPAPETAMPRYSALVYLCEEDDRGPDAAEELRETFRDILAEVTLSTERHRVSVNVLPYTVSCRDRGTLGTKLQSNLGMPGSHRILGAVAAGPGAEEAARHAPKVPVLTYDTQAEGGDTLLVGARTTEVAAMLSSVLAECSWRRVAVLSSESSVSASISEELRVEGPVRRGELSLVDEELRGTLRRLMAEETRVVVVNADGWETMRTLRLAMEEGLTGCAWVVREWTAASPPPVPVLALRAAPRSASELGAVGRTTDVSAALTRRWRDRRWPAHLVPLTEALVTLTVGSARLFTAREELRYDHIAEDTVRSLRRLLLNETLPGVARNLTFDEHGARTHPILLELWDSRENTPRELTLDQLSASCPVTSAEPRCQLPAGGDAYRPAVCLDVTCAVGTPALLLAVLLLGYGVAALRRRRATRARSRLMVLRAEAGAALLARQRHTGAELRALLVERERVSLLRALGAGRHGRVWLASLEPRGTLLAAKGPHSDAAPAEEGELLREAGTLAPLRHEHVMRLLGVCVGPGPPLLLTSVAEHGDLLRYLRARRPPAGGAEEAVHVSPSALTRLGREAALALGYLASRGIVHRDVRAANCLVDERRSLKLADFGMARTLGDSPESGGMKAAAGEYYACRRRALFPVLWMSPESLSRGAFSCASDVWSLGVLALELVSLGARPFGSLSAAEAVTLVERGGHARLPTEVTTDTRRMIRSCWRREAEARPTATEVATWLETRPEALAPCPDASSGVDAIDADSGMEETDVS